MANYGAVLRVLERADGVGNHPELLHALPQAMKFNLGLTDKSPATLRRAYSALELAVTCLAPADQREIGARLGLPVTTAVSGAAASSSRVPFAKFARLGRSAGAFKRLARIIEDGPEMYAGHAATAHAAHAPVMAGTVSAHQASAQRFARASASVAVAPASRDRQAIAA